MLDSSPPSNSNPPDPRSRRLAQLLSAAIVEGDMDLFRQRLSQGAPLEAIADIDAPLVVACQHERVEMAKALLALGADPNARGSLHGQTPLQLCSGQASDLFEKLLPLSDIHALDAHGANAWRHLCAACCYGFFPVDVAASRARALAISARADFVDAQGLSTLELALRSGQPALIEPCFEGNAPHFDPDNHPLLIFRAKNGISPQERDRLMRALLSRFPMNPQQARQGVEQALGEGDATLFELLSPNAPSIPMPHGQSLAHAGARGLSPELALETLAIAGGAPDDAGVDPLMAAIEARRAHNALALIDHSDLSRRDALGESALDKARWTGLEIVERAIAERSRCMDLAREIGLASPTPPSSPSPRL